MAQAFVQKIFHERRTNSTIQVPSEDSLIDEEQVKQIIETATKSFFEQEKQEKDVKETSVRCYLLACAIVQAIIAKCQSAQEHKVVVNAVISDQEGQGVNFGGQCLWNSNSDRVISSNVSNDKEICVISAFFSKIPQDSSSDEEE